MQLSGELLVICFKGFPGSSAGKETACSSGALVQFLDWEDPLEKGWASLVAQTVKNLPAMWEAWAQSLGWEDPLEESMATHSSVLAWRIPMDKAAWRAIVHGVAKSWTCQSD